MPIHTSGHGLLHSTTGITATASSAETNRGAGQAKDWNHPRRFWRSNVDTESWLQFDLGMDHGTYEGLYLRGVNFEECRLQANDTDSWANPSFEEDISVLKDVFLDRRQGLFFFEDGHGGVNYRYIRVRIAANPVTDNEENAQVGVMAVVSHWQEFPVRADIGLSRHQRKIVSQTSQGHRTVATTGERLATVQLGWDYMWDVANDSGDSEKALMESLLTSEDIPVVFCRDAENADQMAYLARREGEARIVSNNGIGAVMPLAFIEVG